MATVNNRVRTPQAITINAVTAGGTSTIRLDVGYDERLESAPDGLELPLKDKCTEYVRGVVTSQDWSMFIDLLTGALGTGVFYERKAGVAVATGFIQHTLTAPVIHRAVMNFTKGQYGTVEYAFECRPADEAKGISDMWTPLDAQAAPTYVSAARGGYRIASAVYSTLTTIINLYHVTGFTFTLELPLAKESNDGDVGYTCVEAMLDGLKANGSITFQDSEVDTGPPALVKAQKLLTAARDQLVLTVTQGQGGAAKTITLLGVDFTTMGDDARSDVNRPYGEYTLNFEISNDLTTQLTLAGTSKIIAVA